MEMDDEKMMIIDLNIQTYHGNGTVNGTCHIVHRINIFFLNMDDLGLDFVKALS